MRCPSCNGEVSASVQRCYYCGAILNSAAPSQRPYGAATSQTYSNTQAATEAPSSIVSDYRRQFVKSPLILVAIVVYSVYAAILLIKLAPALKYLGDFFDLMEISFFLSIALIACLFLFVPPLVISIGLWKMYSSEGVQGADTVKGGINSFLFLVGTILGSSFLAVAFFDGASRILGDSLGELILPLAFSAFGFVAIASMRRFADAVEYTAVSSRVNTDGVSYAGTMMLIYFGLNLLSELGVLDSLNLTGNLSGSLLESSGALLTITNIAHLLSFVLFGAAALVFCNTMSEADYYAQQEDAKQPQRPSYSAAPQYSAQTDSHEEKIAQLKQYKELLDSGVITQEDFDAKKKQLLGL